MPQGINISWRKQAKVQGPVRERSLPIAQRLPALGGEDVPRASLLSRMGPVPALCNGEVLKSPYASRTIILQHLCSELDMCSSGEDPVPFAWSWWSVTSMGMWGWESDLPCCMSPKGQGKGCGHQILAAYHRVLTWLVVCSNCP